MKIPYGKQLQICRRRMFVSPPEIAKEFDLSEGTVYAVLKRNAHIVEAAKKRMEEDAVDYVSGRSGELDIGVDDAVDFQGEPDEKNGDGRAKLIRFRDLMNADVPYAEAAGIVKMNPSTAHSYSRAWVFQRTLNAKGARYSLPVLARFFELLDIGHSAAEAAEAVGMKLGTANAYHLGWKLKNGLLRALKETDNV